MKKERIPWIDVFKALGIILIVLGHTLRVGVVRDIVYYFHVPAFFFVSGVTTKEMTISKKMLWGYFKRLMVPYYIFGVISILIYFFLGQMASNSLDNGSISSIENNIFDLLYGSSTLAFNAPLWFLPAIFLTKILFQLLNSFFKENKKRIIICSAIFCICGYASTYCMRGGRCHYL